MYGLAMINGWVSKSDVNMHVNTPAFGPHSLIPPQGNWKQTGEGEGTTLSSPTLLPGTLSLVDVHAATIRLALILTRRTAR